VGVPFLSRHSGLDFGETFHPPPVQRITRRGGGPPDAGGLPGSTALVLGRGRSLSQVKKDGAASARSHARLADPNRLPSTQPVSTGKAGCAPKQPGQTGAVFDQLGGPWKLAQLKGGPARGFDELVSP